MAYCVAAAAALFVALIHTFGGGPQLVPPLLNAKEIPEPIRLVHYYCWHIVTMFLFSIAGAYVYAAVEPGGRILAVVATGMCFFCFAWGLFLVLWKKQKHFDMPQWILFLPLTLAGVYALS